MVLHFSIRRFVGAGLVAAIATIAVLAPIKSAHAYIDPGTSGMILQLLLGGVAGGLVVIKLYWHRLRETVERVFGQSTSDKPDSD